MVGWVSGVSRRALLARAGIGTGAGVVALLGGAAAPALAAASERRSRERAPRVRRQARSPSTGRRSWVNTPRALDSSDTADLIRAMRSQEQAHYGLLAPLLNGTAPMRRRLHVHVPGRRAAGRSSARPRSRSTSRSCCSASPSAPPSTTADLGVAELLARVVAGDGEHFAALSVLAGGPALPDGLPRALGIDRRRQPTLPVPLELGGTDDPHLASAPRRRGAAPRDRDPHGLHGRRERRARAAHRRR